MNPYQQKENNMRIKLTTTLLLGSLCWMGAGFGAHKAPLPSVNINQANQKQLISLKGVGKKRAAAIIHYREKHGRFTDVKALAYVPGFSAKSLDKFLQKNKPRLLVK
jgi:competence ComEA-like helix-hairpin-helix protein